MTRVRVLVVTGLLWMCGSVAAGEEGLFPFVVAYDTPANATNVSAWLDRPAGVHGFIRVEGGHLKNDAGPVRFWATNICFEACFPTHQQAERLAARLVAGVRRKSYSSELWFVGNSDSALVWRHDLSRAARCDLRRDHGCLTARASARLRGRQ
ncbi:MAG: hypothetical protein ABSH35_00400 [Isosphaeraceae bacterium]|jgi:hypothetical protein